MNDIETMPAPEVSEAPKKTGKPQDNTVLMSVLAYIGILVLIPYFTAKENPAVQFHIRQGLVLLVPEIALWVASEIAWGFVLAPIIGLLNIGLLILSIIGIINVLNKRQVELPLIGQYAQHFDF